MLEGLRQVLKSTMTQEVPGIYICLDNLGVARNAGGIPKGSSQKVLRQFRDLAEGWLQTGKELSVQWIPGHTGIEGNELADQEAKKQAKLPPAAELNLKQSPINAEQKIGKLKDTNLQLEYQKGSFSRAAQSYIELGLKATSRAKSLPELRLKREVQDDLLQLDQATDTSAHITKVLDMKRQTHCVRGQKRAQLHPFSCAHARKHKPHLWCKKLQRQLAPKEVPDTPEGVAAFAEWAPATGLFHRQYRNFGTAEEGEEDGV